MKKITILICFLFLFELSGCTTYYKQEDINFSKLENITVISFYNDDKYPSKKAIKAKNEDGTLFDIIVMDSDKDVKTKLGSKIQPKDKLKITNAEIAPGNSKNKEIKLLSNESDIESLREIQFEQLLDSNKTYSELSTDKDSNIFLMMMNVEDGELKYDNKYENRFQELKKDYETYKSQLDNEIKTNNSNSDNIPKSVTNNYKPQFGQILEANQLNNKLTIKFKITPAVTNKQTIDQNGFNIEDLITNQGCDKFDEINYWAVADMTDGSESKVISYTLNKDLIKKIKDKKIFGQQIVDIADNVWILPSLKK